MAAAPAHAECGCFGAFALLCQGRTPCGRDQGVTAPSDNVADPVAGGYSAVLDVKGKQRRTVDGGTRVQSDLAGNGLAKRTPPS